MSKTHHAPTEITLKRYVYHAFAFVFIMSLLFEIYSLLEVIYLLISFNKTRFTKNADSNGVNGQNTDHTRKGITLEKVSVSDTLFFRTTLPILPTPPFLRENYELPLLGKNSKLNPPH